MVSLKNTKLNKTSEPKIFDKTKNKLETGKQISVNFDISGHQNFLLK